MDLWGDDEEEEDEEEDGPTEAAARKKYSGMTISQLKRQCKDSWLDEGGSKGEMVDR